jgi:predicted RND superfamily exporter protein
LFMSTEPGVIVAVAAVLFFYLRLIILQRQRVKHASGISTKTVLKKSKKNQSQPGALTGVNRLDIHRPYLVVAGVIVILIGASFAAAPWFRDSLSDWWWLPVTVGIILMSFGIR